MQLRWKEIAPNIRYFRKNVKDLFRYFGKGTENASFHTQRGAEKSQYGLLVLGAFNPVIPVAAKMRQNRNDRSTITAILRNFFPLIFSFAGISSTYGTDWIRPIFPRFHLGYNPMGQFQRNKPDPNQTGSNQSGTLQ